MLPIDAANILDEIIKRWPKWQPTPAQESDWKAELEAMDVDPDRVIRAVAKAYAHKTGNWTEPRLAKICEELRVIPGGNAPEATDTINSLTGVWIVQLETGWAIPIPQGRVEIPLGRVLDMAHEMAVQHKEFYPGEWVVVPKSPDDPLVYDPFLARAWADPVYAGQRETTQAMVAECVRTGRTIQLGVGDKLVKSFGQDKQARTRVRGQAENFLKGGEA